MKYHSKAWGWSGLTTAQHSLSTRKQPSAAASKIIVWLLTPSPAGAHLSMPQLNKMPTAFSYAAIFYLGLYRGFAVLFSLSSCHLGCRGTMKVCWIFPLLSWAILQSWAVPCLKTCSALRGKTHGQNVSSWFVKPCQQLKTCSPTLSDVRHMISILNYVIVSTTMNLFYRWFL